MNVLCYINTGLRGGANARLVYDTKSECMTLLEGSKICSEPAHSFKCESTNKVRQNKTYKDIENKGIVDNYIMKSDYTFKSVSGAASFVYQVRKSGYEHIYTKYGIFVITLGELLHKISTESNFDYSIVDSIEDMDKRGCINYNNVEDNNETKVKIDEENTVGSILKKLAKAKRAEQDKIDTRNKIDAERATIIDMLYKSAMSGRDNLTVENLGSIAPNALKENELFDWLRENGIGVTGENKDNKYSCSLYFN